MRQTDDEIAQEVWDLLEFDLEYKENYTYEDFYVMLGVAKVFNSCNYRIKPDRWITKDGHHIPIIDNIEMYVKRMLYGKIFKSKEEDVQKVLKGYVSKSVPECWTEHSDKTSKSKGVIYPSKYPETIAGVKRGWEMSHEEADSGKVNPNYLFDIDAYKYNCQCCVVAYEVRRRGFDVEAAPQEFMGKPFSWQRNLFLFG